SRSAPAMENNMKKLAWLMAALFAGASACGSGDDPGDAQDHDLTECAAVKTHPDEAAADRLWARVPDAWQTWLAEERSQDYFPRLAKFVEDARADDVPVYPPEDETFTALELASPKKVKVVILGQDPYFNAGQAHGLAFSVKPPT